MGLSEKSLAALEELEVEIKQWVRLPTNPTRDGEEYLPQVYENGARWDEYFRLIGSRLKTLKSFRMDNGHWQEGSVSLLSFLYCILS